MRPERPSKGAPERQKREREQPKRDPVKEAIDRMLERDRHTPRKQRHTAVRSSGFPVKTASWYRRVLELSPPPSLFYFPGGVRLDVEAP